MYINIYVCIYTHYIYYIIVKSWSASDTPLACQWKCTLTLINIWARAPFITACEGVENMDPWPPGCQHCGTHRFDCLSISVPSLKNKEQWHVETLKQIKYPRDRCFNLFNDGLSSIETLAMVQCDNPTTIGATDSSWHPFWRYRHTLATLHWIDMNRS